MRNIYCLLGLGALLLLTVCAPENPLNPDDQSFGQGMVAFAGYADSSLIDLDIFMIDTYEYSPTVVNVSNSASTDCTPVWSYNRRAIAYLSSSGIYHSIFAADPITLDNYLLLNSNELILKLIASPNAARLAYITTISNQTEYALNTIDMNSLDTLRIAEIARSFDPQLAWSPDGNKLAVETGLVMVFNPNSGEYLYSINTQADFMAWDAGSDGLYVVRSGDLLHVDTLREEIILSGYGLNYPAVSPDRKYIAAVSQSRGNELIVIDPVFGSFEGIRQITIPSFECNDYRCAAWSPDSRQLAYLDLQDGRWDIYIADEFYNFTSEILTDDNSIKNSISWK
jgi:Tol biopolymer transport system component